MIAELEDFIRDAGTLKELASPRNRLIMAIGCSDSGKTTLVECVADFCSVHAATGVVDLDMGQSHIGPPTTIAWGRIRGRFDGWEKIAMESYYFAGTTTPVGSLLPALAGAKLMTEKALASCKKVVVDTTGLISGPAGRALKHLKIDLLRPDVILALERSHELAPVLDAFRFQKHPTICRLPAPEAVRTKTATRRGRYRFEQMKKYLIHSRILSVSVRGTGMRFTREVTPFGPAALENRIVSFRDEENNDIGLGLIEKIDLKEEKLLIRTPMSKTQFASLVIGRAEMDRANSLLVDTR